MKRPTKPLLLAAAVSAVAVALSWSAPHADAYPMPGSDRDVHVWRVKHLDDAGWEFTADVDKQPGEKVLRVYVAGRPAERSGSLWYMDTDLDLNANGMIHLRVVTTKANDHGWVRTKRLNISSTSTG